jgi:hypothetical protein
VCSSDLIYELAGLALAGQFYVVTLLLGYSSVKLDL